MCVEWFKWLLDERNKNKRCRCDEDPYDFCLYSDKICITGNDNMTFLSIVLKYIILQYNVFTKMQVDWLSHVF